MSIAVMSSVRLEGMGPLMSMTSGDEGVGGGSGGCRGYCYHNSLYYMHSLWVEMVAGGNDSEGGVHSRRLITESSNMMILGKDYHENGASGEDYDSAVAVAFGDSNSEATADQQASPSSPSANLQPYTLEDALYESSVFECMFAIIVYDPLTDTFIGLYNKNHRWKSGNKKLWKSMRDLAYMLRKVFPDRFNSDMPELVLAIGSGDYPHVRKSALPHLDGVAPVLMFGSAFQDADIYHNMLAMPMPEARHLECFYEWVKHDGGHVCEELRASKSDGGNLVFGGEYGFEWDSLIVSIVDIVWIVLFSLSL